MQNETKIEPMINFDDYHEFCLEYYGGLYPNLRFGQAFCNKFHDKIPLNTVLYYATDNKVAEKYIFNKYVIYDTW